MKKISLFLRILCLVAVVCMLPSYALAYKVYQDGDISIVPQNPSSTDILLVNKRASVARCVVLDGGILVVAEGVTLTVTQEMFCGQSTIYVYGALDLSQLSAKDGKITLNSTTIHKCGGALYLGNSAPDPSQYTVVENNRTYSPELIKTIEAQIPSASNGGFGWPQYYLKTVISASGITEGYYEDEACTRPITNLAAWKNAYSAPYKACYDGGVNVGRQAGYQEGYRAGAADVYSAPTEPGMRLKITTKRSKTYEFLTSDLEKVGYYRATE